MLKTLNDVVNTIPQCHICPAKPAVHNYQTHHRESLSPCYTNVNVSKVICNV